MKTFIFNLNKNQKYKKLNKNFNSIFCDKNYGPHVNCLGFYDMANLKTIVHYGKEINNK